jgi:NAD(P)-dependent dehydrogenase (short-subunit alcohol dehydrogenase family)
VPVYRNGPRMERVFAGAASVRRVDEAGVCETYRRQNALKTFIQPEEVANVGLFVCLDAGSLITGQALCVDGHAESLLG